MVLVVEECKNCPAGHPMRKMSFGEIPAAYQHMGFTTVYCDKCGKILRSSKGLGDEISVFYHCPICSYDICVDCREPAVYALAR